MKPIKPITHFVPNRILALSCALIMGLALAATLTGVHPPTPVHADSSNHALLVQVQASQGFAAPGNALAANFLVVVSDRSGAPVTNLTQTDFTITNQFGLPGQTCGFSNNIVSFVNVLNGAYRIQIDLPLPGCTWVEGDYLAYVRVVDGPRQGQAPATLALNCPDLCTRQ
jgi:hypothetical protein